MKLNVIYILLSVVLLSFGCSKENAILPVQVEPLYHLPQGNHAYDQKILEFYNTYGCYILYKFSEKDFRWNVNADLAVMADQGEESYIEPALTTLDNYLFRFYSTELLKKVMPYKIILASRIRSITRTSPLTLADDYINTTSSYSHLAFGRASSTLGTLTDAQLKVLKAELHREFWKQAFVYNKVSLPPIFAASTDYAAIVNNTVLTRRAYGVFTGTIVNGVKQTGARDFSEYMYNIALLTPQEWEQTIFTAVNDPAGKYRLKYNAIINYFKEVYGSDLQNISLNK
jgi:hypothetical protein